MNAVTATTAAVFCPDCGTEVPPFLKHLPSRETDGASLGGCLVVAVDEDGRTHRERVEWLKLRRAAEGRRVSE